MTTRSKLVSAVAVFFLVAATVVGIGTNLAVRWSRRQAVHEMERVRALAANIANDKFEGRFRQRPFRPDMYQPELRDDRWHWGKFEPGEFYSAEVSFRRDTTDPQVQIFWATDGAGSRPMTGATAPPTNQELPTIPSHDLIGR